MSRRRNYPQLPISEVPLPSSRNNRIIIDLLSDTDTEGSIQASTIGSYRSPTPTPSPSPPSPPPPPTPTPSPQSSHSSIPSPPIGPHNFIWLPRQHTHNNGINNEYAHLVDRQFFARTVNTQAIIIDRVDRNYRRELLANLLMITRRLAQQVNPRFDRWEIILEGGIFEDGQQPIPRRTYRRFNFNGLLHFAYLLNNDLYPSLEPINVTGSDQQNLIRILQYSSITIRRYRISGVDIPPPPTPPSSPSPIPRVASPLPSISSSIGQPVIPPPRPRRRFITVPPNPYIPPPQQPQPTVPYIPQPIVPPAPPGPRRRFRTVPPNPYVRNPRRNMPTLVNPDERLDMDYRGYRTFPEITGQYRDNIGGNIKPRPGGGNWGKLLTLPFDLTKLGIYNINQEDKINHNSCCLLESLTPQIQKHYSSKPHIASQKVLELKSLLLAPFIRTIKLRHIAYVLQCNINLKKLIYDQEDNKWKRDINNGNPQNHYKCKLLDNEKLLDIPTYELILADKHFFRNDITFNITTYAIKNYETYKNLSNWATIAGINKNGNTYHNHTKPMSAYGLVKYLLQHDYFTEYCTIPLPIPITKEINYSNDETIFKSYTYEEIQIGTKITTKKGFTERSRNISSLTIFADIPINKKIKSKLSNSKLSNEDFKSLAIESREKRIPEMSSNKIKIETSIEFQDINKLHILNKIPNINSKLGTLLHKQNGGDIIICKRRISNSLKALTSLLNEDGFSINKYHVIKNRAYCDTMGIQRESKLIRGILTKDYYIDVDMVNAHCVICNFICNSKYNIQCPNLLNYINNRNDIIQWFITKNSNKLTRGDIKQIYLSLINGGFNIVHEFMNKYIVPNTFKLCVKEIKHMYFIIKQKDESKIKDYIQSNGNVTELTYINNLFTNMESTILNYAIDIFKYQKIIQHNMYTKIFDGFQFIKHKNITLDKINKTIKITNKCIKEKFKFDLQFKIKPIESIDINTLCTKEEWISLGFQNGCYKNNLTKDKFYTLVEKNKEIDSEMEPLYENGYHIGFFDTETDTHYREGNFIKHKEYAIAWCIDNNDMVYKFGPNCAEEFLDSIPDKTILIAHNLNYDYRFLLNVPGLILSEDMVLFNNRMLTLNASYKNKKFIFKDSYVLISMPLSKFPKMFNLPCEKESYPYNLYQLKNMSLNNRYWLLEDAKKSFNDNKKYNTFLKNCKKLKIIKDKIYFNYYEYCKFYIFQDVRILRDGYNNFRQQMFQLTKDHLITLDIDSIISSSSLSERYANNEKVYNGVVYLGNLTRLFVQSAVRGGSVRPRDNYKWKIKNNKIYYIDHTNIEKQFITNHKEIHMSDLDARSLYPSAMERLGGFPKGAPKKALGQQLTWEFLKKQDCSIMKIKITKVGKHRSLPLVSIKINDNAIFDDRLYNGRCITCSYILLEDLITFHEIEFEIEEALYWNQGINKNLKSMINKLYDLRIELKRKKNPLQQTVKLLMNSAYGKTILKEQKYNHRFVNSYKEYNEYTIKNENLFECAYQIGNEKFLIKCRNDVSKHTNMAHCGVLVLDMSKRIMAEVMYLADDNNIPIFYQDTDSMHCIVEDVPKLELLFKQKYNRDLIGNKMGQFHSDFDVGKFEEKGFEPYAKETIICGKKVYYDRVVCNSNGDEIDHIRMKGINETSILLYGKQKNLNVSQIYHELYYGKQIEFNLGASKVMFKLNSNLTVSTNNDFKRNVKFKVQDVKKNILN